MKITGNDADFLRDNINRALIKNPGAENYYRERKLTHKRYRWDMFWFVRKLDTEAFNLWIDHVYTYADDTHIDTLLRSILGKDYN